MAKIVVGELQEWIQQYKDDESPVGIGQTAAIKAMDYFLETLGRHGDLTNGGVDEIKGGQGEIRRCIEILSAFMGRMSIMEFMQNGFKEDDDENI